ncbi:MAG TPA: L,D-transpeptidase [Rubrivivax sp.]|nr:L,D-transpeptidase [Rubrivivax sp.]
MRGLICAYALRAIGRACRAAAACVVVVSSSVAAPLAAVDHHALRRNAASDSVRALAVHVVGSADNRGRPWAVVDKLNARLFVFAADGRLLGATPALLGQARGDFSAPGMGGKAATYIPPEERTTHAGRFASRPGRNLDGEAVVWVDYTAALAIHRLRPAPAHERRAQRLASATSADNRITLGCVVISGSFYDAVVAPVLGEQFGVVYVLPESGHWPALFADASL